MIDAIRSLLAAISAVVAAFAAVGHAPAGQPVILRLNGVACAGSAYCLAVGQDVTHGRAFAELWDAGTWRVIPAPNHGSPEALWDVACFAVRRCLTVGTYSDASGLGFTLAAEWDGTSWRLLNPVSPGIDDQLGGLACPHPGDCIAVGASLVTADRTLAERWDGKRWRVLATPPAGNPGALNAVACPRRDRCVAVGSREGADGAMPRTLAEAWNGRQWRVLGTPAPPSGYGNLVDVSCARPDMCVATGYSYTPAGLAAGVLTEEWDGKAWRLLPFGSPPNADQVPGVACVPGPAGCIAVGYHLDGAGRGRALAGLLDATAGGGWRMLRPAYPAGAEAVLTDIACPSAGRCMAVGNYDFTVGNLPFADLWDGRQWRLLTMPRA